MKMKISEIIIDDKIYPRESTRQDLVDEYVDAMEGGAIFPPLIIHESTKILLDGLHRYLAYKKRNITEVDVDIDPEPKTTDINKERFKLMLRAAWYNARHGIQLKNKEKSVVARKVATGDINGEITQEKLANQLGVTQQTISNWIKDIQEERDNKRNQLIYRLSLLGWTQEEIGILMGIDQTLISKVMDMNFTKFGKIHNEYLSKGYKIEDIANKQDCKDVPLLWNVTLKDQLDDSVKMVKFGVDPKVYNVWNFAGCDERLGYEHAGRIPGQIAMNVLYYYTKQNDLVIDPMAGGGSTIDACLVMNRKCRAYDIKNEWEFKDNKYKRKDIIIQDLSDGFSNKCKDATLVFLDPPYWRLEKEFYMKKSVSENTLEEWGKFMKKVAIDSHSILKKGGYIALVIEGFLDEKVTGKFLDLPFDCLNWFKEAGFTEIQRISIPMPSQIKSELDVARYKKKQTMLDLNRDLIILQKV